jgi:hypothetical protein
LFLTFQEKILHWLFFQTRIIYECCWHLIQDLARWCNKTRIPILIKKIQQSILEFRNDLYLWLDTNWISFFLSLLLHRKNPKTNLSVLSVASYIAKSSLSYSLSLSLSFSLSHISRWVKVSFFKKACSNLTLWSCSDL